MGGGDGYELLRFCNKINTTVIGGASKLFKYFINNYDINEIISYSDSSRGVGQLYEVLGFEFVHQTSPNYYWVVDEVRQNRYNYRKDRLVSMGFDPNKSESKIMHDLGHYRIYDCGSKKYIYHK
jgi:hypothetical protein